MMKKLIFPFLLLLLNCFVLTAQAQTWYSEDIGSVGVSGSSSLGTSGTFSVRGAGSGIGNTADSFQFTYLEATGNAEIITRVVSQTNTSNYANSGVMMRESLEPGSRYAMISVSPGNGVNFTYRPTPSSGSITILGPSMTASVWLRLVRSGSTFAGYQSTDGVNWSLVGQITFTTANNFSVGLAVCSNVYGALSTGVFDHVSAFSLVPQVNDNLKLWLRSDVNVTLSGSNQVSRWADQSGNGNDVTQVTGSNQPTYQTSIINNQPVVHFNGISQYLTGVTSGGLKGANVTMVAVYRQTAGAGTMCRVICQPYSTVWTTPYVSWELAGNGTNRELADMAVNGTLTQVDAAAPISLGTSYLLESTYDGSAQQFYLNGVLKRSNLVSGAITYGNATNFFVGSTNAGNLMNGDIAEIQVYNRALSDSERQDVEAYIYQKYAVGTQSVTSAPTMILPAGLSASSQSVTLSVPAGSAVYYTTDGSAPTMGPNSTIYTGPITVAATTTIKAIAVKPGYLASSVVSGTITIDPNSSLVARDGLQLWLRGDVGTGAVTDSASVSRWADQSGNGNDVTQVTGSNQPTYQTNIINNQPVVHFNGISQYLTGVTSAGLKGANVTMIAVYRQTAGEGTMCRVICQPYGAGWADPYVSWELVENGTNRELADIAVSGTLTQVDAAASISLGTPYLLESTYDGSAQQFYLNGALKRSNLVSGAITYGTAPSFFVGSTNTGYLMNGDIAEILVYNRALSDSERQDVEAYVYQKYAFGNQPVTSAPTVTLPMGTYASSQTVELGVPAGSTVYYTTDGSTPTTGTNSMVYTGPITVAATTTIKAIAVKPGYLASSVVSGTITIDPNSHLVARDGLQLWLRGDVGTGAVTDGASVSQWADQSGNGNDVTQVTGSNQPTYQTNIINNQPAVHFDGISQYLTGVTSAGLKGANVTMISVYRQTAGVGPVRRVICQPYDVEWSNPYVSWELAGNGTTRELSNIAVSGTFNQVDAATPMSMNTPYLWEATYDGSLLRFYLDGVLKSANPVSGPIMYGNAPNFFIGSTNITSMPLMNGDIAEILVYNRALSDSERQDVEAYIYQKYAVGAQPVTNAPTPIDYYNGVVPKITKISGDKQNGIPGVFLPQGLTILLTSTDGTPLPNAPVTFAVQSGGGLLATTASSSQVTTLTLYTGSNGQATVYYQEGPRLGVNSQIQASAGTSNCVFTASASQTLNSMQVISGNAFVSYSGQWMTLGGQGVIDTDRRGTIDYTFSVLSDGVLAFEVVAQPLGNVSGLNVSIPLDIFVDGVYLGNYILKSYNGVVSNVTGLMQELKTGTHTIRIVDWNASGARSLQINNITILVPTGADANGNGVADWVEQEIQAANYVNPVASTSYTSPICIEGKARVPAQAVISSGTQTMDVLNGINGHWYANVPLNPDGTDTTIVANFEGGQISSTNTVIWSPLNIVDWDNSTLNIRKGDSLRLTGYPVGGEPTGSVAIAIASGTNPVISNTTTADVPMVYAFAQSGTYTIQAIYGGSAAATITVRVMDANFGDMVYAYLNNACVWNTPQVGTDLTVDWDNNLSVIENPVSTAGRSFQVTPLTSGTLYGIARLNPGGPIVARGPLLASKAYSASATGDCQVISTNSDGSQLVKSSIVIDSLPPGGYAVVQIFISGATFEDGTTTKILTASDFTNGVANFNINWANPHSVCHHVYIYNAQGILVGVMQ